MEVDVDNKQRFRLLAPPITPTIALAYIKCTKEDCISTYTVLPAKSDVMFCLHSYQGLGLDRLLVY